MGFTAKEEKLFTILLSYKDRHYHVPQYQREYQWNKTQWEQLYDDIDDIDIDVNDEGHFIGSIIYINREKNTGGDDIIYELIDGQQRLTTLSILLAAIYSKLNRLPFDDDSLDEDSREELSTTKSNLKKQLIHKITDTAKQEQQGIRRIDDEYYLLRVQPSTQRDNLTDYESLLLNAKILKHAGDPPVRSSESKIKKAQQYFLSRLEEDCEKGIVESTNCKSLSYFETLKGILDKVNKLIFVSVNADSHSDAFRLFETLNNRGMALSALDIIKNQILAKYAENDKIDAAYDQWQEIVKDIEGIENRFLRQFYLAFQHDFTKQTNYSKVTASNLILISEALIKKDHKDLLNKLVEKAEIYASLMNPEDDDEAYPELQNIGNVGAASSYILLMYLKSLPQDKFENEKTFKNIVAFLEKYYVRRNITNIPATRSLDKLQVDTISHCEKASKISSCLIEKSMKDYAEKPAKLQVFKERLQSSLHDNNKDMTRYLLVALAKKDETKENKKDFWERKKNSYVWTIEHILPQTEKLKPEWQQMIADGNSEKAREIQEKNLHRLGNLTLTGYNPTLSDSDFHTKRDRKDEENNPIGYKNGMALNQLEFDLDGEQTSLAKIDQWTEQAIEARTEKMVDILCKKYAFDDKEYQDLDM